MTFDEFIAKLEAAGCQPEEGPDGQWGAHCPAHEDNCPSLSARPGDSVAVVAHCHADCTFDQIAASLVTGVKRNVSAGRKKRAKVKGRVVATYDYRGRDGELLYQIERLEPKTFRARRWSALSWEYNLNGTARALYRLPEVLAADEATIIWLVEGEKDADRLAALGLEATTTAFGCDGWDTRKHPGYVAPLVGRSVVVLADNDDAGVRLAAQRAKDLSLCESVKVMLLPDLVAGGDVSDWLDAGHTAEELAALADDTAIGDIPEVPAAEEKAKEREADVLVKLARASGATFFYTSAQKAYATFPVATHHETAATSSRAFHRWLQYLYFCDRGRAANPDAVRSAAGTLEALALFQGQEREVYVRVAGHDGAIYLDLGDPEWRVVEISAGGWRVTADVPVRFRRPAGMLRLPDPQRGGSIKTLRELLNISQEDWPLVVGFVVMCFRPRGPYPILVLIGGQGTAKTTNAKAIRALVDPNSASTRAEPKMLQDVIIAANNAWVVAFDNVSKLPGWLSDTLCQLATGGAFGTRMLYSDDDEVLFSAQRPIILNGISEFAARGDLLDRSVLATPPVIDEEERKEDEAFWRAFEEARPQVLGAILDAVVVALRRYPALKLERLPRMADFARWVGAAEPALDLEEGEFMDAYAANRDDASTTALEGSPVAQALISWVGKEGKNWTGTATALLDLLSARTGHVKGDDDTPWPRTGRGLVSVLRRLEPNLRRIGIELRFYRNPHTRTRERLIRIVGQNVGTEPSVASDSPKTTSDQDFPSDGSQNGNRPQTEAIVRTPDAADDSIDLRTQASAASSEQNCRSEGIADDGDGSDDLSPTPGRSV